MTLLAFPFFYNIDFLKLFFTGLQFFLHSSIPCLIKFFIVFIKVLSTFYHSFIKVFQHLPLFLITFYTSTCLGDPATLFLVEILIEFLLTPPDRYCFYTVSFAFIQCIVTTQCTVLFRISSNFNLCTKKSFNFHRILTIY